MKVTPLTFVVTMIFVLLIIVLGVFRTEYLSIVCINNRIDSGLSYAAWSGFYHYDLERYATRKELDKREYRNIYLKDNQEIRDTIRESIIYNLRLNPDLTSKGNSFIRDSLEIVAINIYNPDDLPITLGGNIYSVTTIEIVTKVKFKVPLGEEKLFTKRTIVNADTFLIDEQKE